MRTDDSILMTGVFGAALGAAFGFFEQGLQDPRERHVLKYAVLGGLGFAAFAALKAGHDHSRAPEYRTGQQASQGVDMTVVSTFGAPAFLLGNVQGALGRSLGGETVNIPAGAAVKALPLYSSREGYGYALGASPEAMGGGGQWDRAGWAVWWDSGQGPQGWWVVQSTDVATTESVKRAAALASMPPPRPARRA